jgi:uncharacterized protein (TIGR02301 family)
MSPRLALALLLAVAPLPAAAQQTAALGQEDRPYDGQLLRLSEILGALHYLRALCGTGEGQVWREQMRALTEAEGTTPLRKARLVDTFNRGYRGYARTHRTCTRSAVQATQRFMVEASNLTDSMLKSAR